MPELEDKAGESRNASNIVPDRQQRSSLRGRDSGGGGDSSHLLLAFLVLLVLVGAGVGGWWLYEQWRAMTLQLVEQRERLLGIEGNLSSTSKDLSQSSESVAVGILDLYTEVDKLWGARRKARESAKTLQESQAQLEKGVQTLQQAAERLQGEVADIGVQLTALQEGVERTALLEGTQEELEKLLENLRDAVQILEQRVAASEEWVDGINAWRPELNERLLRLQEMAENLSRPPPASSPGGLQEEPL